MDITGELAKVFMVWWDKQVLQKLRGLDMEPSLQGCPKKNCRLRLISSQPKYSILRHSLDVVYSQ